MSTIPATANLHPIADYTPEKQSPSFSGLINQQLTPTTIIGAAVTLTPAQILAGLILRDTSSGAVSDDLPTAALLVPQIEAAAVGTTIRFMIRNISAGAGTLTLSAGTGGTLTGTSATSAIPYLHQEEYLLEVTAIGQTPTYSIYGLGLVTF